MPITDLLERNAFLYADGIALIERKYDSNNITFRESDSECTNKLSRSILTWNEFDRRANQVANLLLSNSIKQGDKVAILMMNCLEWLPIYFGILKAGALAVPLNFRCNSDELQYCLNLAECSALIYTSDFTERVAAIRYQVPMVSRFIFIGDSPPDFTESYDAKINTFANTSPNTILTDNDLAAIYFSMGTAAGATGFPKAILHTHRALMAAGEAEQNHHMQTHDDIFLCIPPLYHTGAKMHWFGSLMSGSSAVLLCNISPHWILETMSQERATIVWLLLPWACDILDAIDNGDIQFQNYDFSHWRLTHTGAQPIPADFIKKWLKQFPGQTYDTNYGLTEATGPGCVHLGIENTYKAGAIGKAGYGWEIEIFDDNLKPVQSGKVGELAVKGNGVMVEYYNDAKATSAVFHDGWLLTGDMAYEDEQGFIYLVDRKKDLIISGGENIDPVQIENYLLKNPEIQETAVIGFPDFRLGEIVGAVIELKPDSICTRKDIYEFCKYLPKYKRPRKIVFDVMPRDSAGRINKVCLRDKYK
ncbi:MAG: acyl--CoA ligase [Candidatus Methanofastidiosa archaeon]|nr:acyl--CoA ligase [Candidatus Methanofastidiosa archaeon]